MYRFCLKRWHCLFKVLLIYNYVVEPLDDRRNLFNVDSVSCLLALVLFLMRRLLGTHFVHTLWHPGSTVVNVEI